MSSHLRISIQALTILLLGSLLGAPAGAQNCIKLTVEPKSIGFRGGTGEQSLS